MGITGWNNSTQHPVGLQLRELFRVMTSYSHFLSSELRWRSHQRDCGGWLSLDAICTTQRMRSMIAKHSWFQPLVGWVSFLTT